jgi:uncharacterized protein YdaU (DUF1376 family)
MNYYAHHLGDYAEATAHLSFLEDAAYSRLIRKYYATEKPFPCDVKTVQRLVGARTKEEREAVATVLAEFFVLYQGSFHNTRCDREIAAYRDKQSKAKRSADSRWSATKTPSEGNANAVPTQCEGNANQEPIANSQEPEPKTEVIHTELDTPRDESDQPEGACLPPDPVKTTEAGLCCKAIMNQGVQGGNPTHPTLIALIEAGATETEFANAARDAVTRGHHSFAYVVGIVKRRREEAAKMVLHQGRLPNKQEALEEANRRVAAAWMPIEMREARNAV